MLRFRIWQLLAVIGIVGVTLPFLQPDKRLQDQEVVDFMYSRGAFHMNYTKNDHGRVDGLSFTLTDFDAAWFPEIRKLDALRSLELRGYKFNPYGLEQLSEIRLNYLDIRDTNLTPQQVEAYQKRWPSCRVAYSFREFADYTEYFRFRQELRSESLLGE